MQLVRPRHRRALHPAGNATFVAEVRRTVEPGYTGDPRPYWRYIEPLARSLLEEHNRDKEEEALIAKTRLAYNSSHRLSETIELDELRQEN